jgi:transposase
MWRSFGTVSIVARAAAAIELTDEEQRDLRAVLRTPSASQQQAIRARIVLRAAEGVTNTQIARELGVSLPTVGLWRRNFCERRLAGLVDAPRSGRPREIDDDEVQRVVAKTLEPPPDGSTHWSVRRLAAATGIAPTTVHRIWRDHRLKPHQVRSFKFSNDAQLVEKVIDVVGLYLDPPKGALVLCVDEKTQIQALDRTQPTLPIKPGKAQRMTHDYKRNGTTSLYAALEIATGEVTGSCYPRHTHEEFLAFLNRLVKAYPRRPLHVVLDNSSTHSTPEVKAWLERHRRVQFHFTPTSASWLNMVEIWFSILTKQQVRRGVYHDVPELIQAIEHFIDGYNERAQPFVWTKTAEQILARAIKDQTTSGTVH